MAYMAHGNPAVLWLLLLLAQFSGLPWLAFKSCDFFRCLLAASTFSLMLFGYFVLFFDALSVFSLGQVLGPLELLGVTWAFLGRSWAFLGVLGALWGALGASWGLLGRSWGRFWVDLGWMF